MKQLTGITVQECTASQVSTAVSKPCEGLHSTVSIDTGEPTTFLFNLSDVKGYDINQAGALVLQFKDGATLTIPDFKALADANYTAKLEDGTVIQFADMFDSIAGGTEGKGEGDATHLGFTMSDVKSVETADGRITFLLKDGTEKVVMIPHGEGTELQFADGKTFTVGQLEDKFASAEDMAKVEPAAGDEQHAAQKAAQAQGEQVAQMTPEQLAAVEPAAGAAAAGAGGGSANFGSVIDRATIGSVADVGPIGPTALSFGLPAPQPVLPLVINPTPSAIVFPNPPAVDGLDKQVFEDGSVGLTVTGSSSVSDGSEFITVVISGIPSTWTVTNLNGGVYDSTTGTWTITMPPGQSFNGGPVIAPPANSDVDLPLTVTVTTTNTSTNLSTSSSDNFIVIVDAVADIPTLVATATTVPEDTAAAITLNGHVTDLDGSETIVNYTISALPAGFTLLQNGVALTPGAGGVYTLTNVSNLTITAPANYSGTLTLDTAVTIRDNPTDVDFDNTNNVQTVGATLNVTWTPVADQPVVSFGDNRVYEDGTVTINANAVLVDRDGSEGMVVKIVGIPSTWTITALNGGTYDVNTQTWTITVPAGQDFHGGPTVQPPHDSDVNLPLTLNVTTTDTSGTLTNVATSNTPFTVVVDAVADHVNLSASGGNGTINGNVGLTIATSLKDTDGSEKIDSIKITGVPANVTLSAGVHNADGSWSLTQGQLAGLTAHSNGYVGTFTATVTVNSSEQVTDTDFDFTNNTAVDPANFTVSFTSGPPVIEVNHAGPNAAADSQTYEDTAVVIPVTVTGQGSDQETMVVTVNTNGAIAAGWSLDWSNLNIGAGTLVVDAANERIIITLPANTDITGSVSATPPVDSDVDSPNLTITAVATEPSTGSNLSSTVNFVIEVDAVADVPILLLGPAVGNEDQPIPLSISPALDDRDGSETLALIITGVPAGATLSVGTKNADGSWTIIPTNPNSITPIPGLTLTPPTNFSGTINLTVTAVATETNLHGVELTLANNVASYSAPLVVTVNPRGDDPSLVVHNAQVYEDQSVTLNVQAAPTDPSEFITVQIGNLTGWTVTNLNGGTYNTATGVWSITLPVGQSFNGGPTVAPNHDSDVNRALPVTVISNDGGSTATVTGTLNVVVDAVADHVNLTAAGHNGAINTSVNLDIATSLRDVDGSEKIDSIKITGVPANVTLSAGVHNADGSWSLTQGQLAGLTAHSNGYTGTFTATVTVNSSESVTDTDFDFTNNNAVDTANFTVTFTGPPIIEVNNAGPNAAADGQTYEDVSVFVPVTVTGQGSDQETMVVTISGLPAGWTIDASGLTGGVPVINGSTITINLAANTNLGGGIRFTPPLNSDVDSPTITVSATATDAGVSTSSSQHFIVEVDAVADVPNLTVAPATGNEDSPIALTINSSLKDTDGSEVLSLRINGVPANASLSAGTKNADGSWSLTQGQLAGLQLNPPANFSGTILLTVIATATETNLSGIELTTANNVASTQANLSVTVTPDADTPTLTVNNAQVYEDQSVTLSVQAAPTDSSESITVTIGNLSGWTVTALNGGTYNAATGVWSITLPAGVAFNGGPTVAPNHDSDVNRALPVTVTSTDGNDTATVNGTLNVVVDAVADHVNLSATGGSGDQGDHIPVTITTSLRDVDGSEEITSIKITGIPAGVTLSAGVHNADGSWSLTQGQLAGLQVIGGSYTGSFTATVTVDSREKVTDTDFDLTNNNASDSVNFTVSFDVIVHPPIITVNTNGSHAQVYEDNSVFVPISVVGQGSNQETMVVTISGLPTGWVVDYSGLVGGTPVAGPAGTITINLPANTDLSGGIRFTPPHDSDVDSPNIHISAIATEPSTGDTASSADDFFVQVDAVADHVNLTAAGGTGAMNTDVAINIATSLKDTDGSERIDSVTISGVPAGVTLSAGTLNANGTWSLTTAQLAGLTAHSNGYVGTFHATVAVASSERVTDTDFDLTNNNAVDTAGFDVTFNNVPQGPFVVIDTAHDCVFEDTTTLLPFSANFTGGNGDEVLTVTVTGLPLAASGWVVNTGGVGTYNAAAGTWTITLPAGTHSFTNSTLTVTPPHNSDKDYNNIVVTASLLDPDNGNHVTTDTKPMPLEVDAVADGITVGTDHVVSYFFDTDIHTVSGNKTVPFAANFSYSYLDNDGSEHITNIVATGANAHYITGLYINADGQLCGTFNWTGTLPASFTVDIAITTHDTPTDSGECTLTNNDITQIFQITFEPVQIHTPLALDLDGDGINLVALGAGVTFDMNGDGHKEQTAWLSGKDAFLALDRNHDGVINNASELFGNDNTHKDGFASLAEYDTNHDGVIDHNDAVYADLKLWTDVNGDGISQESELYSLLDKGIASINLNSQSAFDDKGADYGVVTATSTFTTTDGQTHDIVDMAFAISHDDALTNAINEFVVDGAKTTDNIVIGPVADPVVDPVVNNLKPTAPTEDYRDPIIGPQVHEVWGGPAHVAVAIDDVLTQMDDAATKAAA